MSLKNLVELEEKIESGSYIPEQTYQDNTVQQFQTGYNPMDEMKQMVSGGVIDEETLRNSKLPKEIIESFINKPPMVNEETYKQLGGSTVDTLQKKEGWISRVKEIDSKVKSIGKPQVTESSTPFTQKPNISLTGYGSNNTSTDSILLQVLDRLHKIEERLDEVTAVALGGNELKAFQLTDAGEFMFLDSEGNVYKASLEYRGKKKKK